MNPARQVPRSAPRAPNAPWRVAVACHIPIRLEGPTRTMRGVPACRLGHLHGVRRIWRVAVGLVVVLAGAAAGYGGDRRRPVTRGCRARQLAASVGLASEGRGESCRPVTARPRVNLGRLRRVTLAAHPSRLLASVLVVHGRGRQARRAGGAPLKT
jgi:hypothetical protein